MSTLPFTYDEFDAWHRGQAQRLLRPALSAANTALAAYLDKELTENQRVRVKVAAGRIKNPARTWRKLNLAQYQTRVTGLDSIPTVLDDLIATRIICTNTSDLDRVWDLLLLLDTWEAGLEPVLALEGGSERDYCIEPKETGYRARHINVRTAVNDGLNRSLVTCEIQVRTLLQDSWGELTHEDTYKPGSKIPPLVTTLARRMADLLATLDEIAEDLRAELDIVADDVLETSAPSASELGVNSEATVAIESLEVAAKAYLQRRATALTRPLDLATLAWEMQREFGQEISASWLGYGTFKALLIESMPEIRISSTPPSFVIPGDYRFVDPYIHSDASRRLRDLPLPIAFLKSVDRSFPLYQADDWQRIFAFLGSASDAFLPKTKFDVKLLNELTRIARDRSQIAGVPFSRSAFDYVAKGAWYAGRLKPNMSADEFGESFLNSIVTRVGEAISVSDDSKEELRAWFGLG